MIHTTIDFIKMTNMVELRCLFSTLKLRALPTACSKSSNYPQIIHHKNSAPLKSFHSNIFDGKRPTWHKLRGNFSGKSDESLLSNSQALRRKGHLKEQDAFINFILNLHASCTSVEVAMKLDRWIGEHQLKKSHSFLSLVVPSIGLFFTPLNVTAAMLEYNSFANISHRVFVRPNFAEVRHVLNIAQVHGSSPNLKLISFDADGTIYADGQHVETDDEIIFDVISLLLHGINVAIVTAAGYPHEAHRYEQRLSGLLNAFRELQLSPDTVNRFFVLGGECNYLLRTTPDYRLQFIDDHEWKTETMKCWNQSDISNLLDIAQERLTFMSKKLGIDIRVIRKERSVGVIPLHPRNVAYENFEELALVTSDFLRDWSKIPFCAFNGGHDVFVDVGNKCIGLTALMEYLGLEGSEVLHTGDRFTLSGNDAPARTSCSILWVANPEETVFYLRLLLSDLGLSGGRHFHL